MKRAALLLLGILAACSGTAPGPAPKPAEEAPPATATAEEVAIGTVRV